ncbi:hypothetical protein ACQ5SP_06335 [Rhodovulum sp. YNF3179]|uniref:hypothetical protein n=1 Tax=Rhodovulum sp. YNF3179 TaxID=3425127 RepID=UPI003D356FF8
MNIRRGMFRIWVMLTVIWLGGAATVLSVNPESLSFLGFVSAQLDLVMRPFFGPESAYTQLQLPVDIYELTIATATLIVPILVLAVVLRALTWAFEGFKYDEEPRIQTEFSRSSTF